MAEDILDSWEELDDNKVNRPIYIMFLRLITSHCFI